MVDDSEPPVRPRSEGKIMYTTVIRSPATASRHESRSLEFRAVKPSRGTRLSGARAPAGVVQQGGHEGAQGGVLRRQSLLPRDPHVRHHLRTNPPRHLSLVPSCIFTCGRFCWLLTEDFVACPHSSNVNCLSAMTTTLRDHVSETASACGQEVDVFTYQR